MKRIKLIKKKSKSKKKNKNKITKKNKTLILTYFQELYKIYTRKVKREDNIKNIKKKKKNIKNKELKFKITSEEVKIYFIYIRRFLY